MGKKSSPTIFLTELFEAYTRNNIMYCLLRNYKKLPDSMNSSDLDILISRSDKRRNRTIVYDLSKKHSFIIYNHYVDERFDQFFLYKSTFNGNIFLMMDFFFESELYGVKLIEGNEILKRRIPYRNFYIADDIYRFLDKWLYLYLVNVPPQEKYHREFREITLTKTEGVSTVLSKVFGPEKVKELLNEITNRGFNMVSYVSNIERFLILLRCSTRDLLFHFWHLPLFCYYRLKYLLFPQGEFISLSGPDGSGKTTILELALSDLKKAFRMGEDNVFHFRPSLFPRIAELAQKARVISSIDNKYHNPHRAKTANFVGSLFRLIYYSLDYIVGYFVKVRPKLVRRELVISDRYFYDIIADPERSRISLPLSILQFFSRFIPLPNTFFLICTMPEKILERKRELTLGEINVLNERYSTVAKYYKNSIKIGNDENPEQAAAEMVKNIIRRRAQRFHLLVI